MPVTPRLPEALARRLRNFAFTPVTVGLSGASVYRLEGPGPEALFLKVAPTSGDPDPGQSPRAEAERLEWLGARGLPVPRVEDFLEADGQQFLLTSALAGRDASSPWLDEEKEGVVVALADGLRRLHAVSVEDCPFDGRLEAKLDQAWQRLELGQVDEADLDEFRQHRKADGLFEELLASRPSSEDLVFCHGDYCLPNVFVQEGELAGFVDVGRAGVADRYQDLALVTRSLESDHNPQFGPPWAGRLLELYGPDRVDASRIEFYRLLDEFF